MWGRWRWRWSIISSRIYVWCRLGRTMRQIERKYARMPQHLRERFRTYHIAPQDGILGLRLVNGKRFEATPSIGQYFQSTPSGLFIQLWQRDQFTGLNIWLGIWRADEIVSLITEPEAL